MCSACGYPAAPGHWTDAGAHDAASRLRLRLTRVAAINRILAPYGLTARDDGVIPGFQISSPTGHTELVPNLEVLWTVAGRMVGTPIDPLSERALSHG